MSVLAVHEGFAITESFFNLIVRSCEHKAFGAAFMKCFELSIRMQRAARRDFDSSILRWRVLQAKQPLGGHFLALTLLLALIASQLTNFLAKTLRAALRN